MKKDKKGSLLIKAVALVLGLFVIGYIVGRIVGRLTKGVEFSELFEVKNVRGVGMFLAVLQAVVVIGGLLAAYISFARTKKRANKWDGEDEEEIDAIENALNFPMITCSMVTILGTILFSCACYFLLTEPRIYDILPTATFIIGMVGSIVLNEQAVTLEKKLNPEKEGSTFDRNFHKKWMDSCDEAQKQVIWQSGFAAYQAGNMACYFLWIFTFILQMLLRFGLMPMLCVGIIWLTLNTSYMLTAARLERGK